MRFMLADASRVRRTPVQQQPDRVFSRAATRVDHGKRFSGFGVFYWE